jgi:hypothetical protein
LSAEDPKLQRARDLAKSLLALMSDKETREFRKNAKQILDASDEEEEEAAADEVDAEIAKAMPSGKKDLKKEDSDEGSYVDREHGPFTELVQSVFGTRFIPTDVLRDALEAFLGSSVKTVRPGFVRLSKPALPAIGENPKDGIYAVWYDDRNESMLIRLDDWLAVGRHLYEAGTRGGLEMSAKARERYGSRGLIRKGRGETGPVRWEWRWIDFEVTGNEQDGFEVDRATRTNFTVVLEEDASDQAILRELRKEVLEAGANTRTILLEDQSGDAIITCTRRKGSEPLGELRREQKIEDEP